MRTTTVFLLVALVYACLLNMFMVVHFRALRSAAPAVHELPRSVVGVRATPAPCAAWSHAALVLAPREAHPRSNDPSDTVRALAPTKRLFKRLASGAVYLAVAAETYAPAHSAWCERLQHETAARVACHLLPVDNATAPAALAALRARQPCLAAALVVEDPTAVDNGLLGRMAAVSTGHYACLAALRYRQACPVYIMPVRES